MKEEFKKNWLAEKELIQEAITELKTPGKRHRQIPNLLTLSRMLAPLFIIPSALAGNVALTIGFATLSCLTDLVDGFIARKWNLTSKLGADLDAITDKVFSGTLLLTAAIPNPVLFLNLLLELVISYTNVKNRFEGENVSSSYVGKAKTWFLFTLTLLGIGSLKLDLQEVIPPLSLATAAMQGATIGSYRKNKTSEEDTSIAVEATNNYTDFREQDNKESEEKTYSLEKVIGDTSWESQEDMIEELKKMRSFFTTDVEEADIGKEKTGAYQKVKTEERG